MKTTRDMAQVKEQIAHDTDTASLSPGAGNVTATETACLTEVATPREAPEKPDDTEDEVSPRNIHGWKWGLAVAA